jgi:hypothetical protein
MLALLGCAAAIALGASQAGATPTARGAAANTMIASAINATAPDTPASPAVKIEGTITAAGHRFAYRQCRVDRTIHVDAARISGTIRPEGDTYPTRRSGHFDFGPSDVDYGGTDSTGRFYDGHVPWSGGTITFFLSTPKIRVARDRLGFRSYTCRPLSLTVTVAIPPNPHGTP